VLVDLINRLRSAANSLKRRDTYAEVSAAGRRGRTVHCESSMFTRTTKRVNCDPPSDVRVDDTLVSIQSPMPPGGSTRIQSTEEGHNIKKGGRPKNQNGPIRRVRQRLYQKHKKQDDVRDWTASVDPRSPTFRTTHKPLPT
jgi:hypothetical protein